MEIIPEAGRRSFVQFANGNVTKVSKTTYSYNDAVSLANQLEECDKQLQDEPIPHAALLDVQLQDEEGHYRVAHKMDAVAGQSLQSLPDDARHLALSGLVTNILDMSPLGEPDKLRVPIDSAARNWHMGENDATLVDIFHPYTRDNNGDIVAPGFPSKYDYYEKWFGTKSGTVSRLLLVGGAFGKTRIPTNALKSLTSRIDSFGYEALPENCNPVVKDRIRQVLKTHGLSYFLNVTKHMVNRSLKEMLN